MSDEITFEEARQQALDALAVLAQVSVETGRAATFAEATIAQSQIQDAGEFDEVHHG